MPRCEWVVAVIDDAAFGYWDSKWGDPIHEVKCSKSARLVMVVRHAAGRYWPTSKRSVWRVCEEHAGTLRDAVLSDGECAGDWIAKEIPIGATA